ncbi:MAG: hypothetical protein AVDCRST_MAG04-1417, partial [uncultured Acetobacteraceae bacterium]
GFPALRRRPAGRGGHRRRGRYEHDAGQGLRRAPRAGGAGHAGRRPPRPVPACVGGRRLLGL